jgi:hypothetical protein
MERKKRKEGNGWMDVKVNNFRELIMRYVSTRTHKCTDIDVCVNFYTCSAGVKKPFYCEEWGCAEAALDSMLPVCVARGSKKTKKQKEKSKG